MKRLNNKVALVTGAAGGMGAVEAKLFAEEGASVMATDIQEDKLSTWIAKAGEDGLDIISAKHDVASDHDWKIVIEKTLAAFGKIDILVNNAGIFPAGANTLNTTREQWDHILAVNVTSAFIGSKLCVPYMQKNGRGSIINISSIAGFVGGNGPAYTASKGALRLLTKDMAVEFAKDNIRVNSIHPGGVLTPMTEALLDNKEAEETIRNMCPMARIGNSMEIAWVVLYLASDESSYTTGAEFVIDGGLTAR